MENENKFSVFYSPCHAYPIKAEKKIEDTKKYWEEITGKKVIVTATSDHGLLFEAGEKLNGTCQSLPIGIQETRDAEEVHQEHFGDNRLSLLPDSQS